MIDPSQHPQPSIEEDEETPWLSFSDAVTALLFVFIATTFWFMFRLEQRTEQRDQELSKLRGADAAASALLSEVSLCLEEHRAYGVRVRPVVEPSTHTMSIYIEPQASTIVEWFKVCSAEITPDAATVVKMARSCLSAEVPALAADYTVLLTLEGHTDARIPGAGDCRARFPSNWELSGARAGAALRRLLCEDGSCEGTARDEADTLRKLSQDRERLQLVAAGRAESVPAWRALCAADWPGASLDEKLDAEVCRTMADTAVSPSVRGPTITALIAASPISSLHHSVMTFDEALVAWANDPRCSTGANAPICEERFRRLRRVDMRVDLRPRAAEPREK